MPETKVECIKDFIDLIKVGDKATVIPIPYDKDTILVREGRKNVGTPEEYIWLPEVVAKKGTYKSSFVRLENGREIPGDFFNSGYGKWFKKI